MAQIFHLYMFPQTEMKRALQFFEDARSKCDEEAKEDESYYNQISVTIK